MIYEIMREAGVPEGVVVRHQNKFLCFLSIYDNFLMISQNFIPADGPVFGDAITKSPHLAGINFTGSVP